MSFIPAKPVEHGSDGVTVVQPAVPANFAPAATYKNEYFKEAKDLRELCTKFKGPFSSGLLEFKDMSLIKLKKAEPGDKAVPLVNAATLFLAVKKHFLKKASCPPNLLFDETCSNFLAQALKYPCDSSKWGTSVLDAGWKSSGAKSSGDCWNKLRDKATNLFSGTTLKPAHDSDPVKVLSPAGEKTDTIHATFWTRDGEEICSTSVFSFVCTENTTVKMMLHFSDILDLWAVLNFFGLTRNDCIAGAALLRLTVERREAHFDSSGSSLRIRSDGQIAKKGSKGKADQTVCLNMSNQLFGQLEGYSIPNRLARSIRSDIGVGINLCEAFSCCVRLLKDTSNPILTQSRTSAIDSCAQKLHPLMQAVVASMQHVTSIHELADRFRLVVACLNVLLPKQDMVCVPHPSMLYDGWETDNIYKVGNIHCKITKLNCILVPGLLNVDAMTQILAMSSIGAVYGTDENMLVAGLAQVDFKRRNAYAGKLSRRGIFSTGVLTFNIANKDLEVMHFKRGDSGGGQNIVVPRNAFKATLPDFRKKLFAPVSTQLISAGGGTSAMQTLRTVLDDATRLKSIRTEWHNSAVGDDFGAEGKSAVTLFGDIVDQHSNDFKAMIDVIASDPSFGLKHVKP